jgi:hypothetical protein
MQTYRVNLYKVFRVDYREIEANSAFEAAVIAREDKDNQQFITAEVSDCEGEVISATVDVVGADDNLESEDFEFAQIVPAYRTWVAPNGAFTMVLPMDLAIKVANCLADDSDMLEIMKDPRIQSTINNLNHPEGKEFVRTATALSFPDRQLWELADHEANMRLLIWTACDDLATSVHLT